MPLSATGRGSLSETNELLEYDLIQKVCNFFGIMLQWNRLAVRSGVVCALAVS